MFDQRLGTYLKESLWNSGGQRRLFMTTLLSDVLGVGPGAMVFSQVPDMHYFSGRGGKDVIPLWRDSAEARPNIARAFSG